MSRKSTTVREFNPPGRSALSILAGMRPVEATSTYKLATRLFETKKRGTATFPEAKPRGARAPIIEDLAEAELTTR